MEVIGALASCSQLCSYISRAISRIRTALDDLKEAPQQILQRIENLKSLGVILDSIQRNRILHTSCIKDHLEQIRADIILLQGLLFESSDRVRRKSLRSFWYCLYVKPRVEDRINVAFTALEIAKSNLQLFILNDFGEAFSDLVQREPSAIMPGELPKRTRKLSDKNPLESDQKKEPDTAMNPAHTTSSCSKIDGGKVTKKDSPMDSGSSGREDQECIPETGIEANSQYKTASRLPDGGDATQEKIPTDSGLGEGKDQEHALEKAIEPNSQYETASRLLDCNVRAVHYGNKLKGIKSEARYGDEYNNAPPWFVEQQRRESANRMAFANNTTSGEGSKVHHGHKWNFKPGGDEQH